MTTQYFIDPRGLRSQGLRLDGPLIKVIVGPDAEPMDKSKHCEFMAHEEILRCGSDFFNTMLSKEWKETEERVICLPDQEPEVFHTYIQWLYFARLYLEEDLNSTRDPTNSTHLIKLYGLGEVLVNPDVQDCVIDALVASTRMEDKFTGTYWYPVGRENVDLMYALTPEGSPGRRLMVDWYVCQGEDWLYEDAPSHPDFYVDLAKALMEFKNLEDGDFLELEDGVPVSYHKVAR